MQKGDSFFYTFAFAMRKHPIGIFDSGYGGLTILSSIRKLLPQYDYIYLGDNARAPYGPRSFDVVYRFTLQAVRYLFAQGCPLVILACNTASAKALKTIQTKDLPYLDPNKRVLGVIRPTVEAVESFTKAGHVGIVGTSGTIASQSYEMEIAKLFPDIQVVTEACPMWVPLVESGEASGDGADYFVRKHLDSILSKDYQLDTLLLACTHYPLLLDKIRTYLPAHISVVAQGDTVAYSLQDYLHRHSEIEEQLALSGNCRYLTTECETQFAELANLFLNDHIEAEHVVID